MSLSRGSPLTQAKRRADMAYDMYLDAMEQLKAANTEICVLKLQLAGYHEATNQKLKKDKA